MNAGLRVGTEIDTLDALHRALADDTLARAAVQGLDLRPLADRVLAADVRGTILLGCTLDDDLADRLRARGALVFPDLPDIPFNPYQPALYRARELYDGVERGYQETPDAKVYAWTKTLANPPLLRDTLAMALHDDSITDSLDDILVGHSPGTVVGVMGGHAVHRGDEGYRDAARLGALLAEHGLLVATGGGPGAMEAANLGAACPDGALDDALARVSTVPSFTPDVTAWVDVALAVVASWDGRARPCLGIPTWFYGHEPPNVFASGIAKYFSNALREDVLLDRCRGGIVYLPGAAGTVQELFQALTGDYYAATDADLTPLVLVGKDHWTRTVPAWPLLKVLTKGRPVARHIHLVDDVAEAVEVVASR